MTRRQNREQLIQALEQGNWTERVWLPLVRLIHRLCKNLPEENKCQD